MPITIRKGLSENAMNLTPLIDMVFLLLIFFLVATKFEEEERWQAENPEKHRLIRQIQVTVLFLEKMMGEIRGK